MKRSNVKLYTRSRTKHDFLLAEFFENEIGYTEKHVGNFWLIKQFNKKINLWEVAIYRDETYHKKKRYQMRIKR